MGDRSTLWAIILAGGEGRGRRLAPLTERLHGVALPKQFATVIGEGSLLQQTVARISPLVPPRQMVAVVPAAYAELAAWQLACWPELQIVPQPANLDTGPGLLLGLAAVLARDDLARVVIVPSDHHVPQPEPFLRGLETAATVPAALTLVGAVAERPETDYGWICRGPRLGRNAFHVAAFVEKPPAQLAARLLAEGALWNTFVMAGEARSIWGLAAERLPAQAAAIAPLGRRGADAAAAYAGMAAANFSREVLEPAARALAVVGVRGCGWSDLGTPERVLAVRGTRRGPRKGRSSTSRRTRPELRRRATLERRDDAWSPPPSADQPVCSSGATTTVAAPRRGP
jgi:mannose-1-phosphate guanylyltransferase